MIRTACNAQIFQIGAGLSGYVAELGSVFFAADLGLEIEPRDDHAAYIQSWITVLQNDKRAIFQAASMAEKALGYLHSLQPEGQTLAPYSEEEMPKAA